jgi:hypothetical protein
MLKPRLEDPRGNEIVARSLTHDPVNNSILLGCPACPHYDECGGLAVSASLMDCLDLCCGLPDRCTRVCPNAPERFVQQRREILGFDFDNIPRAPSLPVRLPDELMELIYHGSRRVRPLRASVLALRLADLVDFRRKRLRFSSRAELCDAFHIDPAAAIVLSGVDHDHRIEPWWSLGEHREEILKGLAQLGISLVTTPNFSVVLDNPRMDDLHALKRIGIVFAEFQHAGIPCALHPNGRTERDFDRWAKFIAERPEVGIIAYEFITGPGQKLHRGFHLDQLARLARASGRPLDIIVRGDPAVIPTLRRDFRTVYYIDTTAFIKAQKRQAPERVANDSLRWISARTPTGAPLDALLEMDLSEQLTYLRASYYGGTLSTARAA